MKDYKRWDKEAITIPRAPCLMWVRFPLQFSNKK